MLMAVQSPVASRRPHATPGMDRPALQTVVRRLSFGYPMIFLSGATIPLEVMPESVHTISDFLPLTYVVRLLRGLWFGETWGSLVLETGVLIGVLVVSTAIAARLFRWE